MIRHSIKLIWNQKKKNAYLILELFLMFIVLFLSSIYLIEKAELYLEGTGADVEDSFFMWLVKKDFEPGLYKADLLELRRQVKDLPEVENMSYCRDAIPYTWNMSAGSIRHDSNWTSVVYRDTDENFKDIFRLNLIAGEWFEDDWEGVHPPAILDRKASLAIFDNVEDALGKEIIYSEDTYIVKGVIDLLKRNEYEGRRGTMIMPMKLDSAVIAQIVVRYRKGEKPNPAKLTSMVYNIFDKEEFSIRYASTMGAKKANVRAEINSEVKLIVLVTSFLIINLILGLIGVLGYKAKRRNSELGIRRAVGSTSKDIHKLLMYESWALTLFALIPAFILVVQIPILDLYPVTIDLFMKSMITSILLIFFFVTLSVYYPGRLASRVEPAEALQEE